MEVPMSDQRDSTSPNAQSNQCVGSNIKTGRSLCQSEKQSNAPRNDYRHPAFVGYKKEKD